MIQMRSLLLYGLLAFLIGLSACNEDDGPQPVTVNFAQTSLGLASDANELNVALILSRAPGFAGTITIDLSSSSLQYGAAADYYTNPVASNGQLSLVFAAADESVNFTILKGSGLNINEDLTLDLRVSSTEASVLIGANSSASLTFTENFIAPDGLIELNAGGEDFGQQDFVDLSKQRSSQADRLSWDIGLYSGDDFRVVLNSPGNVMARELEKTNLALVSSADTAGFAREMIIPQFDPSVGAIAWVDTPDGNLETTAFGTLATSADAAQVFIVRRESGDWQKVKVWQEGSGYALAWASIDATQFNEATVSKDPTHNFVFFSFDNGAVSYEPAKTSWDFMYGSFTEALNLGGPGLDIPYGFKDFIVINRYQTRVAMVFVADVTYEAFTEADLSTVTFSSDIDAIGENWRMGGGPGSAPALHEDRFFVLEDAGGNYYKIRFTRLTSLTGERGRPEFSYELLSP